MGILSGSLTARRFRVLGEVPEGFRDTYRERLDEFAFTEPPNESGKQEVEGWVQYHNLLDTSFDDANRWLYEPYLLFMLRIDKKVLPAKLLRAHVDKEAERWCAEREQDRCPPSVKSEIREALESKWLRETLPRVRTVEICWNYQQGYVVLHSLSDKVMERVRKRFYQTFGLRLVPWSPLDFLEHGDQVEALMATAPTALTAETT